MKRLILFLSIFLILSFLSCSTQPPVPDPVYDTTLKGTKPAGTQTLVLTGSALNAKAVTINGLSLNTGSVQNIQDTTAAIFASDYADGVLITESASGASDYTVDFTAAGKPDPDIYYGANIQIVSAQYLADPVYRELAKNMKLDIVRFPGGQERVKYDKSGTALTAADKTNGYDYLLTGNDVTNYIGFCQAAGAKADLEFNVFTSDSAMWKTAADQIVNDLKYPLEYMAVGNEPDINTNSNWTYFDNAGTYSAAMTSYITRYLTYASDIRSVKSNITFILGELSGNAEPKLSSILDQILPTAASNPPGAFSTHWYLLGDWGQSSSDSGYPSISHLVVSGNSGTNIRNLANFTSTIRTKLNASLPAGTKLVIGEWGTSWSATPGGVDVLDTLATAIYTAEVLEYGKTLGIDSMQYFGLSDPANFAPWNSAMIVGNTGSFSVRPQYYPRMVYKHAWGSTSIQVPGGQTNDYSIYASKDGTNNYLMLICRAAKASYKRMLTIKTASSPGGTNVQVLILPKSVTVIRLPL